MNNDDDTALANQTANTLSIVSLPNFFSIFYALQPDSIATLISRSRVPCFPIAFDHESVKKNDTQPIDQYSQSLSFNLSSNFTECAERAVSIWLLEMENSRNNAPNGRAPSLKSLPPSKQNAKSEATAKAWLLRWFIYAHFLYCHITHQVPHCTSFVQLAHVCLPKSEAKNNLLLLMYEYALGMPPRSFCVHNRLFLMPSVLSTSLLLIFFYQSQSIYILSLTIISS
ncbi:hypothetical protein GYMLUDRAFT_461198 [Collybiopsis luxurians FD-317 M1]|uniref:Uncharacterized protein n=1 Tax=Collybiopsis luxurians FD-317 M1 TaxID=944289 RepID=A0A0D0BM26_9AGAR|nr:hypothetical protein GYMLUDRAFT_461198 [Collybiopsis luxurians FD-317 M1]